MNRLQKERERRGWTKTELARRAQIDLAGYSRVERGLAQPFRPWKERLSRVLEVPENELFAG